MEMTRFRENDSVTILVHPHGKLSTADQTAKQQFRRLPDEGHGAVHPIKDACQGSDVSGQPAVVVKTNPLLQRRRTFFLNTRCRAAPSRSLSNRTMAKSERPVFGEAHRGQMAHHSVARCIRTPPARVFDQSFFQVTHYRYSGTHSVSHAHFLTLVWRPSTYIF